MPKTATKSLSSEVVELAKEPRISGKQRSLTEEQRKEYQEMILTLARMLRDDRPTYKSISALVSRKFGIKISPRTILTHVQNQEECSS